MVETDAKKVKEYADSFMRNESVAAWQRSAWRDLYKSLSKSGKKVKMTGDGHLKRQFTASDVTRHPGDLRKVSPEDFKKTLGANEIWGTLVLSELTREVGCDFYLDYYLVGDKVICQRRDRYFLSWTILIG